MAARRSYREIANLRSKQRTGTLYPPGPIGKARLRLDNERQCYYCRRQASRLQSDHIEPLARGGDHSHENTARVCWECNRTKGDLFLLEWVVSGRCRLLWKMIREDEMRVPTNRPPTHPAEMLRDEFLIPFELTDVELARRLRVRPLRIATLMRRSGRINADLSLRLGKLFNMTPDFWMNLQLVWDLYHAMHSKTADEIAEIEPIRATA